MSPVYGCHNRKPLNDRAVVPDGWGQLARNIHVRLTVTVPDEMSKECQYTHTDLGQMDPKCAGCEHRKPAGKEAA